VEEGLAQVQDLLTKAVKPVASVWDELSRDLTIDQVEIDLKPGYSGGPLLHPETGLVVGVFNLRRDKQRAEALCVEAHRLLGRR